MTSSAQWKANRLNAQKSTGPRTERGRQRVANNAQKHGLSCQPKQERVLEYLRPLLKSELHESNLGQLLQSDYGRAALSLAIAEARLEHVQKLYAKFDYIDDSAGVSQTLELLDDLKDDWDMEIAIRVEAQARSHRLKERYRVYIHKHLRAFRRHLNEAHGQRRMAFKKFLEQKYKTKPNSDEGKTV